MPVPDYADDRPAYAQIAGDIRARIKAGEYAPGDRLPSVREMTGRYGVAYETIRQAIKALTAEGRVISQSTRGVFVLRQPEDQPSEYEAVMGRVDELAEEIRQLRARVEAVEQGQAAESG